MSVLSIAIAAMVSLLPLSFDSLPSNDSYKKLEAAFSEKKSYYIIEDEVDLKGRTLKFPKDAVIDFRGGRLKNGTVCCDNNSLIGYAGIAGDIVLSGKVLGRLNLSVFVLSRANRNFDIGQVLNKANKVCKSIIVPDGVFYLKTPVVLESIKYYLQYGDLIYNGKAKDATVLQFNYAFSAVVNINGKIIYDYYTKVINYSKKKRTNIIGVDFLNINNSNVFVNDVEFFNNNIRVSASGDGNCYNKYTFNISVSSNEHLRICQKDTPSKQIGWCNENIFIGGRFCNWSDFDWDKCESYAIVIKGEDRNDTYNSANSLLFIKPCMEGFKNYAVVAKNVYGCHWQDARTEDSGHFIKFEGNCANNLVESSYGTSLIDYEDCLAY